MRRTSPVEKEKDSEYKDYSDGGDDDNINAN